VLWLKLISQEISKKTKNEKKIIITLRNVDGSK
jgi:hypothetical protein